MKVCSGCRQNKFLNDFSFRNKANGTRMSRCKSCISDFDKKNYKRPEKFAAISANRKARKQSIRDRIWKIKSNGVCVDCGEDNPVVLEFDHIFDKKFNISRAANMGLAWETIQVEINKCEIVCANCHRIRTHKRSKLLLNMILEN